MAVFYVAITDEFTAQFLLVIAFPFHPKFGLNGLKKTQMNTLLVTLCRKVIELCKTSKLVHLYICSMFA